MGFGFRVSNKFKVEVFEEYEDKQEIVLKQEPQFSKGFNDGGYGHVVVLVFEVVN